MTSTNPERGIYVQRTTLHAHGEKRVIIIEPDFTGKPDYCRRCLAEKMVYCFKCKKPIFYDDPYKAYLVYPEECFEEMGIIDKEDGNLYGACCTRPATGCQSAHSAIGRWKSARAL